MERKIEEIVKYLRKLSYVQLNFVLLLVKSYLSK